MEKFNIDLSKAIRYVDGEEDRIIRDQLIKHRLYNQNCLYSVFNGRREKQILETGNYRKGNPDSIFALTKNELVWEAGVGVHNDIKTHSAQYPESPAIAVYDKNKFHNNPERGDWRYEYFFKNPDNKLEALLGIAFLNFVKPNF